MTNDKDRIVIWLLIILLLFSAFTSFSMNSEVDSLRKAVEAIAERQEIQATEQNQMSSTFTATFTEIEDKLDKVNERLDSVEHRNTIQDERLSYHLEKIEAVETQKQSQRSTTKSPINVTKLKVKITEADIRMIASLVYLECGSKSYKCQLAVASVIINRMNRYNKTARQVIYEDGVFSPAYKVRSTKPSSSCLKAVRQVVKNGSILPKKVVCFRNKHYHTFGRRYCCIDGVYFSSI